MNKTELLQARLTAIGENIRLHPDGLALIGLGSVGKELHRLDDFSDLDFYAIVREGSKSSFIEQIDWLTTIAPVAFKFRNSDDGYKLLYADGVFCEFGVYTLSELDSVGYNEGRIIWADASVPTSISVPKITAEVVDHSIEFLLGELLTNLYVGLSRYRRGEKCSAMRFVQVFAVDRLIALLPYIYKPHIYKPDLYTSHADKLNVSCFDAYSPDRRVEQRYGPEQVDLSVFMQGYNRVAESAEALLDFTKRHFEVNAALEKEIRALLG